MQVTTDSTADIRKRLIESGVVRKDALKVLESGDPFWTSETLKEDFEVLWFAAPFCAVRRKADGATGTLEFLHSPRIYFDFAED
jgi:hypothetical protein